MAAKRSPRQTRRRTKRKNALYTPLAFVVICAALIFGMSVFFRVSKIEVVGAESYTAEEIIEAAGIEVGDNLFFIDRSGAGSRVTTKLPYIEKASISRNLPSTVTIHVTESRAIACLTVEGEMWALDSGCKVLSQTTTADMGDLILVTGLTAEKPVVGEKLTGQDAEQTKIEFLAALLEALSARGMEKDITGIDMTNLACPVFDYEGRFQVKLGKNEDLDYKLDRLLSVADQLGEGNSGTLDLSIDDRVHFSQG